jgi:hypothetical protein
VCAEFAGQVVTFGVGGSVFAPVPSGEGGKPVELEALNAKWAEVLYEVFRG